jgi:homocitrate synthase NifV
MNLAEKRPVCIIDTTLRDGAQAADIAFSPDNKLYIADLLYKAGIRFFEAGIPVMGEPEQTVIATLTKRYRDALFIGWCRAKLADLDAARRCGCKSVHISFPASLNHIKILGYSESEILDQVSFFCDYASKYFDSFSIGAQDASRASYSFLHEFVKRGVKANVSRIRIADTVGILTPIETFRLFTNIKTDHPECRLEIHAHNDLGMATANTITALQAGADAASVTVNGIGERAGNAALEEVVMALQLSPSLHCDFNTSALNELCQTVAELSGMEISRQKPITGSSIFKHQSGIHCHALLKNRSAYEPYDPSLSGHTPSRFVCGTHSGRTGILSMLAIRGISISTIELDHFFKSLQNHISETGKSMTADEVCDFFYASGFANQISQTKQV